MPKVSVQNAQVDDHGPVLDRHREVDGYTISFIEFRPDMDQSPMLKGLPDDRCPQGVTERLQRYYLPRRWYLFLP